MTASLRELVLAVRYGHASLVGESVGYIILGAADRAAAVSRRADLDSVLLCADGAVELEAGACSDSEAERSLRALLASLLSLVRSQCPNLERVARRGSEAGLRHLIVELEAALVPVNRKAARRSLSRLVREARRSARLAEQNSAVAPVMQPAFSEPAVEARPVQQGTQQLAEERPPRSSPEVVEQRWRGAEGFAPGLAAPPRTSLNRSLFDRAEADAFDMHSEDSLPPGEVEAFDQEAGATLRQVAGADVGAVYEGQPVDATSPIPPRRVASSEGAAPDEEATGQFGARAATPALVGQPQLSEEMPAEVDWDTDQEPLASSAQPGSVTARSDSPHSQHEKLDAEDDETAVRAPVEASVRPRTCASIARFVQASRAELPSDVALLAPLPVGAQGRVSDAAELLGEARTKRTPSSELYKGLRSLSRIELSADQEARV